MVGTKWDQQPIKISDCFEREASDLWLVWLVISYLEAMGIDQNKF